MEVYGKKLAKVRTGTGRGLTLDCTVTNSVTPAASVARANDEGISVVFTPHGSWMTKEAPI